VAVTRARVPAAVVRAAPMVVMMVAVGVVSVMVTETVMGMEAAVTVKVRLLPQLAVRARVRLLPLRLAVRAMEAVAKAKAWRLLAEKVMAALAPPSIRLCQ